MPSRYLELDTHRCHRGGGGQEHKPGCLPPVTLSRYRKCGFVTISCDYQRATDLGYLTQCCCYTSLPCKAEVGEQRLCMMLHRDHR